MSAPGERRHALLPRSLLALWSAPIEQQHFDILIVGSGYGGSMAAAVMAGCTTADAQGAHRPLRVGLLERGAHWTPGEFPSRMAELPRALRLASQGGCEVRGNAEGLFDLRPGDDVAVLAGSGVGGGSLINAGVLMPPRPAELRRKMFRATVQDLIDSGHCQRAGRELGASVMRPSGEERANGIGRHAEAGSNTLPKARALALMAADGDEMQEPALSVAMRDEANAAGVQLPACSLCGDCMSGCNVGAKNSLDVGLLERAAQAGGSNFELYTGAHVSHVLPAAAPTGSAVPGLWQVWVEHTRADLQSREAGPLRLSAQRVILAAGALGSTEILLRSRAQGLSLSPRLGERFSCNGDNLSAIQGLNEPTQACADEHQPLQGRGIGPTITRSLRIALPGDKAPQAGNAAHAPATALDEAQAQGTRPARSFLLQEFAVPAALADLFGEIVTTARSIHSLVQPDPSPHGREPLDAADPQAVDPARMARTLLVGSIGHDDAAGRLVLGSRAEEGAGSARGGLRIDWPGARHDGALDAAQQALEQRVRRLRGTAEAGEPRLVPNPLWRPLPTLLEGLSSGARGPVVTVHPLGGCPMGEGPHDGVVDDLGRVFTAPDPDGRGPARVHEGLVVLDGAVVPESLGANPALTIAAIALRAGEGLRVQWGLRGGLDLGRVPATEGARGRPRTLRAPIAPAPGSTARRDTELQVVERLRGPVPIRAGNAASRSWIVELTLAYQPVALGALTRKLRRTLAVDAGHPQSRLRLFDAQDWEARGLGGLEDAQRAPYAVMEAGIQGELRFLHREDSSARRRRARALWAWWWHRGMRDLWDDARQRLAGRAVSASSDSPVRQIWDMASRAGEVRRFDYDLRIGPIQRLNCDDPTLGAWLGALAGQPMRGHKRLTYALGANPWRQLTQLRLDQMPGLSRRQPAQLVVDPRFLARQGFPMLRVVSQADQVGTIVGLGGLALMLARIVIGIHLWTFRAPDAPGRADPPRPTSPRRRLPGAVAGVPGPELTWLRVAPGPPAVVPEADLQWVPGKAYVRLARYPGPAAVAREAKAPGHEPKAPLVMIHGYSVSGNTFTHPSIPDPAVRWFHERGREVWVVELRTSAALPTAVQPWAMEEVALVDIPAALGHVQSVTGQRVDVLAHCIGCVMLSMALLSDARHLRRLAVERGEPCALDPEPLEALDAFNGPGGTGRPHPVVRRVVLSQKGPVLRYTDANVLRGWLMQFARRWLLRGGWSFEPSPRPGLREQLLDRLLASLPYPDEDWRVENPRAPWKRTPWTASRHRMDALYGRDFNAQRMEATTLAHIDELFGPMSLDTVAQTIAFTLRDVITDRDGRGDFVTRGRLRERWSGIPTLAVHGADNGLVDAWTQRLLAAHFGAAGVPFEALTVAGAGHQDMLIGRDAAGLWACIETFLERPTLPAEQPPRQSPDPTRGIVGDAVAAPAGPIVRLPWVGPRIDILDGLARVAAMPAPDAGRARLVLVPVEEDGHGKLRRSRHAALCWATGAPGPSRAWQFANAPPGLYPQASAPPITAAPPDGWLALMIQDADESCAVALDFAWPGMSGPSPVRGRQASAEAIEAALDAWLLEQACVAREAMVAHAAMANATAAASVAFGTVGAGDGPKASASSPGLCFAFGSCQYPPGALDADLAQASLHRLAQISGPAAASADGDAVALVLLLGDQIYADATAGLVDPTRNQERYDQPYEAALRAGGMRRLMARVPVVMAPDDHELVDNWEPRPPASACGDERWALAEQARQDGTRAFWAWGRARLQPQPVPPVTDTAFVFAGVPFRLCDTRLGRGARGAGAPLQQAQILGEGSFDDLLQWLLEHRDRPKFVATPSLLLPRRRELLQQPWNAARSDAWDGFPASLERLLDFIARERIQRTTFLSGDEHHALACEVWLRCASGSPEAADVKLLVLHSSALHAPFPFANGRPEDLDAQPFCTGRGTQVTMRMTVAPPGDGFVTVSVSAESDALAVGFAKDDGRIARHRFVWGDSAAQPSAAARTDRSAAKTT